MATVTYLTSATNATYSSSAIKYVEDSAQYINDTATILHISAGAIAGAMARSGWIITRNNHCGLSL